MNEIETKFFDSFENYVFQNPVLDLINDDGRKYAMLKIKYNPFDTKIGKTFFQNCFSFDITVYDYDFDAKPIIETICVSNDNSEEFGFEGYKPDFVITCKQSPFNFVIEIDGHQWHEKTKEQAAYDRRKDRVYIKNGYTPIRFTGSEVYHNAILCIQETIEICGNNLYLILLRLHNNKLNSNNGDNNE